MDRPCRWTWYALLALHLGAAPATPQHTSPLELAIAVRDLASVPPDLLRETRLEVDRTFYASGVRLIWTSDDAAPGTPAALTLYLVGGATTQASSNVSGPMVVGVAPPAGTWAQVFYRRVAIAVAARQVPISVVLAHVIAHELGHLLLPPNSHSRVGVMQHAVDLRHPTLRRFTSEQSILIRTAVASGRRYVWPCDQ